MMPLTYSPTYRAMCTGVNVRWNGMPAGECGFAEWNVHANARFAVANPGTSPGVPFGVTVALFPLNVANETPQGRSVRVQPRSSAGAFS